MTEQAPPKMPLWVKVLGIVLIVVAVLVTIMVVSGGEHGPSRHIPSGNRDSQPILSADGSGYLL